MKLKIIGKTKDLRTQTNVLYAQVLIPDYLALVGENFNDFSIQRRREKHKGYERMQKDIKKGALLPPITLAVKTDQVRKYNELIKVDAIDELEKLLVIPNQVNILDGLQRTYILHDLHTTGFQFLENQMLLLEFWFEENIRNLIYRIIVLNAGQKPMSMRHQLEVLFLNVKNEIEKRIVDFEIYQEKDESRRTKARKYAMDRIVSAYQAYLYGNPELQKENIVAQQLLDEEILEASEDELGDKFDSFVFYLNLYSELDSEICRIYIGDKEKEIPTGTLWFGSENVMIGFFAAISQFGSSQERRDRIVISISQLLLSLKKNTIGDDPLGLEAFQKITQGFNTRRVNVGTATRKLLTSAFKEYFRDEGEHSLKDYWIAEAN